MATPQYTQSELQAAVNGMVHSKFAQCASPTVTMNRAVRYVMTDLDLRSTKRQSQLSPNMFENVYDYAAPSDLKGSKVIDIKKQVNRASNDRFILVDESDFDRRKNISNYRIAVRDTSYSRILRVDGLGSNTSAVLHTCDSITSNGTWVASADASNITVDSNDFVQGAGSLNFDTASGAATAVLTNSSMTAVDLSTWDEQGSIFLWVFIPDSVDLTKLTNFILRWGNDSGNYWHKTVTTNNEGLSFYAGWNLLRFDWSSATEVGTVSPSAIDYLVLTITKNTGLAADTDWRIDDIVFRKGDIYYVLYYSKYGWTTSAGTYIEESTTTTDLLIADTDEFELIANKTAEYAAQELKEKDEVMYFKNEYENLKRQYLSSYPSEALRLLRDYGMKPRIIRL